MKNLSTGDTFRAKAYLSSKGEPALCTVLNADAVTNLLKVEIKHEKETAHGAKCKWVEDGWNLKDTLLGFSSGDFYDYKPFGVDVKITKEIVTKFHSTLIIKSVSKKQLYERLKYFGYFNIRFSGKANGFYSDCIKGKEPII